MPPLFNQGDELSLRHLPDVSDTSFSFQIPGTVKEDNLLAQDHQDFFGGVDFSSPTLKISPSQSKENLTISQLTPRPAVEKVPPQFWKKPSSFSTSSYDDAHDTIPKRDNPTTRPEPHINAIPKPKPKIVLQSISHPTFAEGSPTNVQIGAIGREVDVLTEDLDGAVMKGQRPKEIERAPLESKQAISRLEKRERLGLRHRQKVIEGGVVKTRRNVKISEPARHVDDVTSPQQKTSDFSASQRPAPSEPNGDNLTANSSMSSMTLDGGVAERLVQYSQNLINSFGSLASDRTMDAKNDQPTSLAREVDSKSGTAHTILAPKDIIDDADSNEPLTLSQLSPRKRAEENDRSPPANVPTSPLRPSIKRPVSETTDIHLRKRSKGAKSTSSSAIATAPKNLSSGSTSNLKARLPPTRRHPERSHLSGSSSSARLDAERITRGNVSKERGNASSAPRRVSSRQPPVSNPGSRKLNDDEQSATRLSSSSGVTTSSKLRVARPQWDDTTEPVTSLSSMQGKKESKHAPKPESRAPLNATRPVPFQLHTEARETRRGGELGKESAESNSNSQSQSQRDKKYLSTIPDFKALHAAHNAELALRKENIRPTIPLPIRWETDERVKERQKFDEMMKEKEREQERLMEMRRREQEEQEEKEVRELRKKAIPKAHEVPEWYKEAPKRKDKTASSIRR